MKSKAVYLALLACVLLLAACESEESPPPEEATPISLTVCVGEKPETLDPAGSTTGETVLYHLYENLLRWEDNGSGWGTPVLGQAESYSVETDFAGNATYTFTLRASACWSDGQPVTAADFVSAWQRLADPANHLPHRELLAAVSGYAEAQETGDVQRLAVSAPDNATFVVTLNGSCAYFLSELCAGAYTMPVREDLLSAGNWGKAGAVTNGAYTAAEFTPDLVRLERSATYYDTANIGPEELYFVSSQGAEEDYRQFSDGTLDFTANLPDSALQDQPETWFPEPVTSVCGVLLNTTRPPFDNPEVRAAFFLAVDTQAAAAAFDSPTAQGAAGLIPYGVADYGQQPDTEPDVSAPVRCWDFRTHSLELVTVPANGNYEENCRQANQLMVQAGYPQGDGFPPVEYVYVHSAENAAVANALRQMWQDQLGVTVTVRGMSQEEYDALLFPVPESAASDGTDDANPPATAEPESTFQMAAQNFTADYNDAAALLEYWRSGNPDNPTGYASEAFDLVMQASRTASVPDVRDALLHDAEAVLLEDAPIIPVCYPGGSYRLADKWAGLYRGPDSVYFLHHITAA